MVIYRSHSLLLFSFFIIYIIHVISATSVNSPYNVASRPKFLTYISHCNIATSRLKDRNHWRRTASQIGKIFNNPTYDTTQETIGLHYPSRNGYQYNNNMLQSKSNTVLFSTPNSDIPSSSTEEVGSIVGEDAAKFDLSQQSLSTWSLFGVLVSLVLASIYFVWVDKSTPYIGLGLGKDYLDYVSHLSSMLLPAQYNAEGTMAFLVSILSPFILHNITGGD